MNRLRFDWSFRLTLIAIVLSQPGCRNQLERQSTPLLAEAGANETNFSASTAQNPYKSAAKSLLERTVFVSTGPGGISIEFRDLFVAPGTKAENVVLPGPAVMQVLSGEGRITAGEKSQQLNPGISVVLAQDAAATLESRGIMPLVLRARIFVP